MSTVTPAHTGSNEYAIIVNSDLTEHPVRFIGTPDQLMQLAGQITTVARSIKAKEFVQLVTTKPIVKIKKSKEFATTSVNNTPEIWYSTTTITLEDEYLDLTISLRFDEERASHD